MATAAHQHEILETPASPRRNTYAAASKPCREETRRIDGDSLAVVVAACQGGDRTAHRQLYDSCHQNVFRLAVRMVGLQDAADVTQQVFLQAFRSIGQFNGRSRFETWLYRLAVNESLQHLRRRRRWPDHLLDWDPVDDGDLTDLDNRDALEVALSRIEPDLRAIFLLREVEELSYRDIATALEIPEGTVGSRLNRARRALRQQM